MDKLKKVICLHHVAGYMMIDIANAMSSKYDECILLTGELRKRRKNIDPPVKMIKIIKYNPKNNLSRLYTWVVGFIQALFYIVFKGKGAHLFITTNPPLGIFIPFFVRNKYTLLIYDIYPDVISEYKILKSNSLLIRLWEKANIRVFSKADRVITIGTGMKNKISKYISPDKIDIIQCWTDSDFLKPVNKADNIFITNHKLDGYFIVMYSGNLGYTHDIEVMIDLAALSNRENLFFLIIGEGDKKKMLSEKINELNLKNIRLLPWQDVKMIPYSLGAADLAVVTLGKGASLMSVPSKIYDIMAVGSPLLSIAEKESEMAAIIEKYEIGAFYSSENKDEMLQFIYKLMDEKEYYTTLRSNSLKASKDFTPINALKFSD